MKVKPFIMLQKDEYLQKIYIFGHCFYKIILKNFITVSTKILSSTTCTQHVSQHVRMISEGSCDTEDSAQQE